MSRSQTRVTRGYLPTIPRSRLHPHPSLLSATWRIIASHAALLGDRSTGLREKSASKISSRLREPISGCVACDQRGINHGARAVTPNSVRVRFPSERNIGCLCFVRQAESKRRPAELLHLTWAPWYAACSRNNNVAQRSLRNVRTGPAGLYRCGTDSRADFAGNRRRKHSHAALVRQGSTCNRAKRNLCRGIWLWQLVKFQHPAGRRGAQDHYAACQSDGECRADGDFFSGCCGTRAAQLSMADGRFGNLRRHVVELHHSGYNRE